MWPVNGKRPSRDSEFVKLWIATQEESLNVGFAVLVIHDHRAFEVREDRLGAIFLFDHLFPLLGIQSFCILPRLPQIHPSFEDLIKAGTQAGNA